ncbi:MAG: hypothetical protein JZD41_05260 [Thermoproteus sp.]|nr:hypothetical protein [Thermoproteus sp.]
MRVALNFLSAALARSERGSAGLPQLCKCVCYAARAAAYAAVKAGAARITLANRTRERAEALARELAQKFGVEARGAGLGEAVRADVIINATPVWDTPLVDLRGAKAYVEFVYNPPETALLREAKRLGLAVVDGIDILVEQGAAAEEIWGLEPGGGAQEGQEG